MCIYFYKCAYFYEIHAHFDVHIFMNTSVHIVLQTRRSKVLKNPHLVDWYFSFRLNEFLEAFLDNLLDCEWRWHRYKKNKQIIFFIL